MFQTLHEISKNLIFVFVWKYVWKYVNINLKKIYLFLFIFGCVGSLWLCAGFLMGLSRGYSLLRWAGFSLRWLLLLRSTGSRHMGFSSCGTRAQQLWLVGSRAQAQQLWRTGLVACGTWDLPRPGLELVFPALAGGFLTTVSSGKPRTWVLDHIIFHWVNQP